MTSRAQRDEVAGIYKCERGNRDEGNVDGEQRLKGGDARRDLSQ